MRGETRSAHRSEVGGARSGSSLTWLSLLLGVRRERCGADALATLKLVPPHTAVGFGRLEGTALEGAAGREHHIDGDDRPKVVVAWMQDVLSWAQSVALDAPRHDLPTPEPEPDPQARSSLPDGASPWG